MANIPGEIYGYNPDNIYKRRIKGISTIDRVIRDITAHQNYLVVPNDFDIDKSALNNLGDKSIGDILENKLLPKDLEIRLQNTNSWSEGRTDLDISSLTKLEVYGLIFPNLYIKDGAPDLTANFSNSLIIGNFIVNSTLIKNLELPDFVGGNLQVKGVGRTPYKGGISGTTKVGGYVDLGVEVNN